MPTITREDGERFVVPSYRDVLSAKKSSLLKREILLLSENYGDYIALQHKELHRYEIAFSAEKGYLLGETVWEYFNRPQDLIYCEELPNTNEAVLVVVKSGSVYLDGSFPLDSITEELVVFTTQQNHFDIHIHGNVPLSQIPSEGKLSFDPTSVHSFTILEEAVFPQLPRLKAYELNLVDRVLTEHGIGVFPTKKIITTVVIIGVIWMLGVFVSMHQKEIPTTIANVVNPYQVYQNVLTSPDPYQEMNTLVQLMRTLYTMPGWYPDQAIYTKGILRTSVKSGGMRTNLLFDWADTHHASIEVASEGFFIQLPITVPSRLPPNQIAELKTVIATLVDRLSYVLPGDHIQVGKFSDRRIYSEVTLTISFSAITPSMLQLIGEQLKGLPLVLSKVSVIFNNGNFTGSIDLQALGN